MIAGPYFVRDRATALFMTLARIGLAEPASFTTPDAVIVPSSKVAPDAVGAVSTRGASRAIGMGLVVLGVAVYRW